MATLRIPLNQTYQKGNTIIHYLAMWGDECSEVLQYLVRVRTPDDKPAFDLNALNHMGNLLFFAKRRVGNSFREIPEQSVVCES